jgi:hypothetical protein
VTSNTTVIDVSFNNISIMKNEDLADLPHLDTILLNNNNISQLEPYVFNQTKNLLYLYLNNNKIVGFHVKLFQFTKKLRYLYLQNNAIRYIHPHLFEYNTALMMLDVSGNNIHVIEPGTFQHNRILAWVYVRGNPLTLPVEWNARHNVLDIDVCGSSSSLISAFHMIPSLLYRGIKYSTILSLKQFTSLEHFRGLNSSEIGRLRHMIFDRLYTFDDWKISTMKFRDNLDVVSMREDSILCYCENQVFWYWCIEQPQTICQNITTKEEIYKLLECDVHKSEVTPTPDSKFENTTSNRRRNVRSDEPLHRLFTWKTAKTTLLYTSVPLFIIILVIVVSIVKCVSGQRRPAG